MKCDDAYEQLVLNLDHNYYHKKVEELYDLVNNEFKTYIDQESDFRDHLKAMKRFMLMEQGDFMHHLLLVCEPELSKEFSDTVVYK